ncbi:MAG TPA: tetratricopeptide repeat protein [Terriglobia bacterium]
MKKETLITAVVFLSFGFLAGYVYRAQTSAGEAQAGTEVTSPVNQTAGPSAASDASRAALPPGHPPLEDTAVVQTLEQQAAGNPQDPAPALQLANYHYDHGNFDQAIVWYQKGLKLDPKNVSASTDLGTCYFNLGRFDDALQQFHRSLAIAPQHQPTLFNIVVVNLAGKHDYQAAETAYQALHRLNPNYPNLDQLKQKLDQARASGS